MSSSKNNRIIGGGQLGQMMAISAIYMGHKVIALDPAAGLPSLSCGGNHRGALYDVNALRRWLSVAMSSPMSLKMSMLTVWMLSKKNNSRDRPTGHFSKSHL